MSLIDHMSKALKVPFQNEWDKTLVLHGATYPGVVNALHQLGFDMTNLGEPGKTEIWQQDENQQLIVLSGTGEDFDPYTLAEPDTVNPRFFQREFGFAEWLDEVLATYRVDRRKVSSMDLAWLTNYFTIDHVNDKEHKELRGYMGRI